MQKTTKACLILFALCAALMGCGGEEAEINPTPESNKAEQGPVQAEILVEASELRLAQKGESIEAIGLVESMLPASDEAESLGYHVRVDQTFDRKGQRLISISPTNPMTPSQSQIDQAAGDIYAFLKAEFDAYTKRATNDELNYQQALADEATKEVKELQRALQTFQESRRGLPQTSASRLERRQLERQIETTLQAQIEANNRIESLQKRIDRGRFVTLLRMR